MIAGIYNITVEQGSTFVRLLSIEQPDIANDPTGETFIPFDLSGYTARMQIRRTIESDTAMILLTTENGGIDVIPETAVNEIKLLITAANTATLATSGVYDLEIIDNLGNVSKVVRGNMTLIPEVTK